MIEGQMNSNYGEFTIPKLSDEEFALFQGLVYREAGIYLPATKKALVVGRLSRRLRELGLTSFGAYYRQVAKDEGGERIRFLDSICTNETYFFREPKQFEILENTIIPQLAEEAARGSRPKQIRVWSAACSTGEEPYSIAMCLLAHFPPKAGWDIKILATDLSTKVLEKAEAGVWPLDGANRISQKYLKRFMLKGTGSHEGEMKAGPEIRSVVQFRRLNLNGEEYPMVKQFDLIFCRNVLIYFDGESKTRVINRLLDQLSPTGYLFLGHSETLSGITERARCVIPTVYFLAR